MAQAPRQPHSQPEPLPITKVHQWTRDAYLVSTDPKLLDPGAINAAFASDALGWAMPLAPAELALMLDSSVCLGVYDTGTCTSTGNGNGSGTGSGGGGGTTSSSNPKQIGLARLVTDYTTLAYLTDVYVEPAYQGRGLGHWLIECVCEWAEGIPTLRRVVLVAAEGAGEAYYARVLGAGRAEDEGMGYRLFSTLGPGLKGWKEGALKREG